MSLSFRILFFLIFLSTEIYANLEDHSVDSFINPNYDYSQSVARVTDLNQSKNLLKLWSTDKNLKYLQDGDLVKFKLLNKDTKYCSSHVHSTELNYIIITVDDWTACWNENDYFKRGTRLKISSQRLYKRVHQASIERRIVLNRKKDFLIQMNKINNFIWQFNEEKLKVVSEYEKKLAEVYRAKEIALSRLNDKKLDYMQLQIELRSRLDKIKEKIKFLRVHNNEVNDRWNKDLHLGLPISRRPYEYSRIKRIRKAKN